MTTTTAHRRAPHSAAARTRSADTTAAIAHALATTRDTHRADPSQPAGQSPEPPGTRLGRAQADTERGLTVYPDGNPPCPTGVRPASVWAMPHFVASAASTTGPPTSPMTADDRAGLLLGDPTAWV